MDKQPIEIKIEAPTCKKSSSKIKRYFLITALIGFVYEVLGRMLIIPFCVWCIQLFAPSVSQPDLPSLQPIAINFIKILMGGLL